MEDTGIKHNWNWGNIGKNWGNIGATLGNIGEQLLTLELGHCHLFGFLGVTDFFQFVSVRVIICVVI